METLLVPTVLISLIPLSETHYSLKEMETAQSQSKYIFSYSLSETHYSLKEMETETRSAKAMSSMLNRRKPTTL